MVTLLVLGGLHNKTTRYWTIIAIRDFYLKLILQHTKANTICFGDIFSS